MEEYQHLLNLFPPRQWNLLKVWERARRKSIRNRKRKANNSFMSVEDSEFLVNYDNWRLVVKAEQALKDGSAKKETRRRRLTR